MKSTASGFDRHIERKSDVRTTERAIDFTRKLERQIGQRYISAAKAKLLGAGVSQNIYYQRMGVFGN